MERAELQESKDQQVFRAVENYVTGRCGALAETEARFKEGIKNARQDAGLGIKLNVEQILRTLADQLPERLEVDSDLLLGGGTILLEYLPGESKFEYWQTSSPWEKEQSRKILNKTIEDEAWVELGPKLLEAAKKALETKSES